MESFTRWRQNFAGHFFKVESFDFKKPDTFTLQSLQTHTAIEIEGSH